MFRIALVCLLGGPALCLGGCGDDAATPTPAAGGGSRVEIEVDASGYHPDRVEARAGEPLTLVFTRTTDRGCGQELLIPDHDVSRELPLDGPVEVTFTPEAAGEIAFTCGMEMYEGAVVVR